MMVVWISLASLASIFIPFSIWNLLRKVEVYEDDIQYKDEYIRKISQFIKESDERLNHPIIRDAFESDDEIGEFFQKMKDMTVALKAYEQNYLGKEKNIHPMDEFVHKK